MRNEGISSQKAADEMAELVPKFIQGAKHGIFFNKEITASQVFVLMHLYEIKKSKVGDLALNMGVSVPTASGIIERMVKQGYLSRTHAEDDRRCVFVSLKPKGEKIIAEFNKGVRERWSEILAYLAPTERAVYIQLIKKIIKALEASKGAE
ncbi:MAG: MarR family transcriptional regulator [Candidatus Omnitrophota bacterium]